MSAPDARPAAASGRSRPWLSDDDLLPALMFVVLGALALLTPVQNDTFWHLRSGQEIWRTGAPLAVEPFSFTGRGQAYNDHWWLSQLAFYGLYSIGGSLLLTAFAGACSFAAVALSWWLVRGSWELRVVLLPWLIVMIVSGWAIRPQAISFVFVAVMAHLIARQRFMWLPFVCVAWSNVHALVVLGVAMAGAAVVEAFIWSPRDLRRSVVVTALCAAAPMLSPVGVSFWPQAFRSVAMSKALALQEYRLPFELADLPFWVAVATLIAIGVGRRSHVAAAARPDRVLFIASVVLACAGASAARNVPIFALVAIPVISRLWAAAPADAPRTRIRPAPLSAWLFLGVSVLIAAAVVTGRWRGREWQTSQDARLWQPLSPALVQAVRRCPDPMFNRFEDGGFLMWTLPERKVFVDSRLNAYSAQLFAYSTAADVDGDYEEAFRRYGINCAIVRTGSAMAERLHQDPNFAVLYADEAREVFARPERE